MLLDRPRLRMHLRAFAFKPLFVEELGWDHHADSQVVVVDNEAVTLTAIAHKRGLVAYACLPLGDGRVPDYAMRRKIEQQVARLVHEHLIVYADAAKTIQVWQWVKREMGKPAQCREHHYHVAQPGDALIQKLEALAFSLDEEPVLTLVHVNERVRLALDVERITKRFYERFKTEHGAFLSFLKGIPDEGLQRWYASVMLNRLMFIYFVQKKGFLDGDPEYLRTKLVECKRKAKNRYYRDFLCPLFFDGFAKRETERSPATNALLGRVPYLDGGLFQRHQIEESHGERIEIGDAAFERLFAFFEAYQWHLDERPVRNDNEVNPDVLGYIFEKYINQKQMGAYYTKEDITGYISQNTVIPFLFDAARRDCRIAFEGDHAVWRLLQEDPDRYIYPAMKTGVDLPLPPQIAEGLTDVSKRTEWNRPAPVEYALPTEIWREVVARRQRCQEIRAKLRDGQVRSIDDLITYNLDIRQFAQDVIERCEGPELLRAFWHAIQRVSVLDPTCGSGAFLFAALNVLEPLYEACLDRMQAFCADVQRSGEKQHPEKFADFRKVLARVAKHPNHRYFVLKSIVVNNLYGVDIMEEAIEICKLRLFLKLVAQIDRVEDIEPLPDIDFNVRAGNTLVGFATRDEVQRALTTVTVAHGAQARMLYAEDDDQLKRIEEKAEEVDRLFDLFRLQQTEHGGEVTVANKQNLRQRLKALEDELNLALAREYGVAVANAVGAHGRAPLRRSSTPASTPSTGDTAVSSQAFDNWLSSHKPFHWFVDFYGIMRRGGFDVIIGNPPYINAAKVRKEYNVKNFVTATCTDIYAWVLERGANLLQSEGRSGMIVPLSLGFSNDFDICRRMLFQEYSASWFSSFARIPSALFSFDVRVRNTIHIGRKGKKLVQQYTTRLHRWFEEARPNLFATMEYAPFTPRLWKNRIPKVNTRELAVALERCFKQTSATVETNLFPVRTECVLHFKKTAYNWLNFCRILPPCYDEEGNEVFHTEFGDLYFADATLCDLALLFLNGKICFAFWCIVGDDFHVARWMFADFPIDFGKMPNKSVKQLQSIVAELEQAMTRATSYKLNAGRRVGNYNLAKCRHLTDRSDRIFAQYLGLDLVWQDIELLYSQIVKTAFDDAE